MAKAKSIKVNFGRTVNLGDFNNVRLDAEIELELEEGEDLETAYRQGFQEVSKQVNMRVQAIMERQNQQQ